jgi:hypothetical protein
LIAKKQSNYYADSVFRLAVSVQDDKTEPVGSGAGPADEIDEHIPVVVALSRVTILWGQIL